MHYRLQRPIRVAGRKVARLRLTIPDDATAANILADPSDGRAVARALMAVTGLDEASIRLLSIKDGVAIFDKLKDAVVGRA